MATTDLTVARPRDNHMASVPGIAIGGMSGTQTNDFLSGIEIFIPKSPDNRFFLVHEVTGHECYDPADPYARGSLRPGDRVVADLTDTNPTPPGPFLVRIDGDLSVRFLDVVLTDNTKTLRLNVRNPIFSSLQMPLSDAEIIGRVRGAVVNL